MGTSTALPLAASTNESRCRLVTHNGVAIVLVDCTGLNGHQAKPVIQASVPLIEGNPPKSVRILTDVTGAGYDKEGLDVLKEWAQRNTPFVRASAVVGAEGLRAAALNAIVFLTNRNIRSFPVRAQALDWLAEQK